ncbi:GNAT family N-acetyltransferase [Streptomyces sp. HU2014]|uniref:Acetyltransferase n=1 Tax=Streptomyces albireticuli TaxID=1940 RepID=A0A1Z2LB93_9ACTN|nr:MULTISPECIES: GNAT family N-acetyltransferase [Streptomyces]ARZ71574.1 acetyltransferase [Streptomyces albireticuli]UQI45031.1 GNAT family N-acetyltransferase [Streptomyces sp. HU2014]
MREHIEASAGLSLRPWAAGDVAAVTEAFAEPLMRWQLPWPVESAADARRWLADRAERWATGSDFSFAVVDRRDTVLGSVTVGSVDVRHGVGWVSYWTTAPARGRGVATHGCRALADWAFADLGLFRLELGHRVGNRASCRVAGAAGFAVEGLQRQKLRYDGVRYDVETHARLACDPAPPGGASG